MGYYMRFILTSDESPQPEDIRAALRSLSLDYAVISPEDDPTRAELLFAGERLGEIEFNRPGDDIFDEDIDELRQLVSRSQNENRQRVLDVLDRARIMVAAQLFWKGEDSEPVLERVDPLWDWLFANYDGLLQADGDGFYDSESLILEMNVRL
jgi:hypothetical protein